ncbi:Rieske (2Fe-2S) protein [Actinospica sp.]|jgi:Rieske Fe-S protein|uniref:Rieske (2Fe-2S) protein n=1 Tax=Actinospica sp. TaxID=1872142 RepID=UPI002BFAE9AD|nr:Rieske (2Fe-2S) protein [Actinospica sp.]HWG28258.1 Rieske (2Fe-2S) protein [Actinospica sp.]
MAEQSQPTSADRRTVLRATALGVAVAGVGVTAAACSSSNSQPQGSAAQTASVAGATGAAGGGTATVAASKVPVDSGFIDQTNRVVVTQPSSGEFKAFTAVCTHAQCTVSTISNNVIQCPCHGSQYSAKDGSVIQGPAPSPLTSKTVSVSGSTITYET